MDECSKLLLGDAFPISPMTNDRSERKGRFIYSGPAAGHIYSCINYLLYAIYFVIAFTISLLLHEVHWPLNPDTTISFQLKVISMRVEMKSGTLPDFHFIMTLHTCKSRCHGFWRGCDLFSVHNEPLGILNFHPNQNLSVRPFCTHWQ